MKNKSKNKSRVKYYSQKEEQINVYSHVIGLMLSVVALIFLIKRAVFYGDVWHIVGFAVFGISLITLYTASSVYHSTRNAKLRSRLNIFDHSSIYVLIAGTYTPYTLVTLNGTVGWILFGTTWGAALIGIALKFFYTGRYKLFSTLMYVLMGWAIVFAIKPLVNNLPSEGMIWLFTGGVSYTIGAILYSFKSVKYNHAIFHIFVLIGSFSHFVSIYFFV